MGAGDYSFIDIAVIDGIRQRFASGDAMILLEPGLERVLWANGAGAALFGHDDIEAMLGGETGLNATARRQIAATSGYPDIGSDRPVTLRLLSGGLASRPMTFMASRIVLPDGDAAILLSMPAHDAAKRDIAVRAPLMVSGFAAAGYLAALVDRAGAVIASEGSLEALGIEQSAIAAMAADAANAETRIAKRMIPSARGRLPAGLAAIGDEGEPGLLLVMTDAEEDAAVSDRQAETSAPQPETSANDNSEAAVAAAHSAEDLPSDAPQSHEMQAIEAAAPSDHEADEPSDMPTTAISDEEADSAEEVSNGDRAPEMAEAANAPEPIVPVETPVIPTQRSDAARSSIEMPTAPVRFVWKTDAQSRFSALSQEFLDATGWDASDIIGHEFTEVTHRLGIDRDGEIAGLLARRDTWSGRSLLWPVAGTDRAVPVDLAALPVYDRDRNFEGFRGFGIARPGEAVSVAGSESVSGEAQPVAGEKGEGDDPFRGEAPAIEIEETPARRSSDKIISLAERRPGTAAPLLSAIEQDAFRAIGDRLKRDADVSGQGAEEPAAGVPDEVQPAQDVELVPLPPMQEQPRLAASGQDGTGVVDAEASEEAAAETPPEAVAVPEAASIDEEVAGPTGEASRRRRAGLLGAFAEENGETRAATPAQPVAQPESEADHVVQSPEPVSHASPEDASLPVTSSAEAETAGPSPDDFLAATPGDESQLVARREASAALASVLDRLPVAVLVQSGGVVEYANAAFLELTGWESIDALEAAGGYGELFAEPEPEERGAGEGRQVRLRRADGSDLPVSAHLQSVPWTERKALLLSIMPEHEGEGEIAAELSSRLEEMKSILDTATDGVVLIGADGLIRSVNRPAEALFGFENADLVGKPFASLFAVESQRAAREYVEAISDNGVASVLNDGREVIGREAQGRFIPLFMTIGRLASRSGYCAVLRDITSWKRAEEELTQARSLAERASSQKTDFLARVSHEIRTPLNAIIGFSELMMDEKFGPIGNDRYRDYLRDINRSGNHVLDLVNDLLDISKIEAGEQEMSYEAVSLNDALGETVAMMQPQANRERVIIRSSLASRLPEVVADLRSVRQIAINLLSNAIRFTHPGGQVIVSTAYEASGDVVMRVRDTGIGMTASEIEQALKPFKQINALKRGRLDGTGLGLPLTKALVEANRARFMINSTPGEGTLVEVSFPPTRVLAE